MMQSIFSPMFRALIKNPVFDAAVFLLIVAAAVLRGYVFSGGDLDTYLPFILHGHDGTLFRNELLLGTMSSHPVYIWKAMSFLLRMFDVRLLMQGAFLLQTLLIAAGAVFFFRTFFGISRSKSCGWMLFLLLLVLPVTSGGYGVYGLNPYGYFHAGALAFGFVLVTYALADRGFWTAGGALTGITFLFHPVTAVYASAFYFLRAALDIFHNKNPLRIVPGALLLFAFALPSLVPAFHSFVNAPAAGGMDPQLWRDLAWFRMNHGYFISAWVPDRFVQLAGCFLALFLCFRKHPAFVRLLPVIVAVAGGLALTALGDLFNVRLLLRLQLGRCSYFLYFLVVAFAAGTLTDRTLWSGGKGGRIAWNTAFLIVLLIVANAARSNQPHLIKTIVVTVFVCTAVAAAVRFFRAFTPAPLLACLGVIVLTGIVPRIPSSFKSQSLRDPWVCAALWCRDNVPKDDIVMVPIDAENFRPQSLRATYCTWKDGAPHMFCDSTLVIWWERMRKLGVSLASKRGDFPALYRDHALDVAAEEGIRFALFPKGSFPDRLRPAYENSCCGVFDLREPPSPINPVQPTER